MSKQPKIWLLFIIFLIGCTISYILKPNYLQNIFIVYTVPVILNFLWLKKTKEKLLIFSSVTTVLFAFPVELASRLANSWDVQSVLPRILQTVPPENLIYAFINFIWVLCFYEYFIDGDHIARMNKRWPILIGLYLILFILIVGAYLIDRQLGGVRYWIIGIFILLIPSTIIIGRQPKLLPKLVTPTIFFACIFFIHEMVSMKLGHWWWPGNYLLPINLFGKVFPIDDVIIWHILSTPALIAGYEFFADDNK